MKKLTAILLAGLVVIVTAGLVIGDVHTAAYKGSVTCKMCHKIMHEAVVEGVETSAHPTTMQKADAQGAIVGDFATNPMFTRDKVAFVLGKGRNEQAYLDANFQVLPALWNVKEKSWKPAQALDGATQCIGCHTTGYDAATKSYAEAGVGCEACHGPGEDHMTGSDQKATILNPKNLGAKERAMVCGQCHSVGKDTTGKFAHPVGFRPGDDLAKAFADAEPTAPGRNQQYSEFVTSKHAQLGFLCVTCHDPHNAAGIAGQLKKPVNELCSGCHAATIKDMATHAPSASASATCATCHMPRGQHAFRQPGA